MNLVDIYRLMRNTHTQAQSIVDKIPEPLLVLDNQLRVESVSRSFYDTFQVSEDDTLGRPIFDLGDGQWNIPDLRHLLEQVITRSTAVVDYEVVHEFANLGWRTMLISAHRLYQPDRSSQRMLLSIVDATPSRQREAEADMLVGELRHRVKNLLAIVQAMARQTVAEDRSGVEYRDDFLGRFKALVTAHDLAFGEPGQIGLRTLIEQTVEPYAAGKERLIVEPGPAITLAQVQIVPLSLILHELATNAVKHGALSVPEGQVRILWDVSNDSAPKLALRWQECGGPLVTLPATAGFGSRLIDFVATRELGGRVELEYLPSGLSVEIVVPMP
ncbi:two-component sensor histidine kinase [Inquilinus ginsengisoli]|uniref:HWE histidine kinase domain-containing protein n=1 Tax=Inquilinus ginsengisoli TaxID=363840 RepID=UPI003D21CC69